MARRVASLDPREPGANLILGLRGLEHLEEQVLPLVTKQLHRASVSFPGARLILWQLHLQNGRKTQAEREMEIFRDDEPRLLPAHRDSVREWIRARIQP